MIDQPRQPAEKSSPAQAGSLGRSGHESFDAASRLAKARKIQRLLDDRLAGAFVLDIGVGAGIITAELSRSVGPSGSVVGLDVRDSRHDTTGYEFRLVEGVSIPFAADTFDVVVSNHVIEHVGEREEQLTHLTEIARVLKPGGTLYVATPNRWTLIEPHFKLPFLSWLPPRIADAYVRRIARRPHYDCRLLGRRDFTDLLERARFVATERTIDAIAATASVEGSRSAQLIARLPVALQRALRPLVPTMIFTAELG